MGASDKLYAKVSETPLGDLVLSINDLDVVGILWEDQDPVDPVIVIWDEVGDASGRVFRLRELFPGQSFSD